MVSKGQRMATGSGMNRRSWSGNGCVYGVAVSMGSTGCTEQAEVKVWGVEFGE